MVTPKGGFDSDFVDPPPKSLECPICLLTLREPHVISCCGNHFCRPCIDRIQRDGKPCPLCNEPNFSVFLHKGVMREINALPVCCTQKELGCPWVGELGQLQRHLNPGAGPTGSGCGFVEVDCTYQCGGRFQRCLIQEHENDMCPKRPIELQLSSLVRKLEAVLVENQSLKEEVAKIKESVNSENETTRAENQLLKEEIARMKEKQGEMNEKQAEMKQKQAEEIRKLATKQKVAQVKENCKSENETIRLENQLLKQEIAQIQGEMQQTQIQQNQEIAQITKESKAQKQEIETAKKAQEQQQRDIKQLKQQCGLLESCANPLPPFYFSVHNFSHAKKENHRILSTPFYSHRGGYKLAIDLYPNGFGDGKGSHVSLFVFIMRGEYDDKLQWPFRGVITLQILHRPSLSWTKFNETTIKFDDGVGAEVCSRPMNMLGNPGWGLYKFLPHADLDQCIASDPPRLGLRVMKVAIL